MSREKYSVNKKLCKIGERFTVYHEYFERHCTFKEVMERIFQGEIMDYLQVTAGATDLVIHNSELRFIRLSCSVIKEFEFDEEINQIIKR